MARFLIFGLVLIFVMGLLPACGSDEPPVLRVGGIPDQDASRLARRYDGFAEYLSQRLGIEVEYVPSADYAAVVTAFTQGNLDMAFFGGLTGVQARILDSGAEAVAQRENDAAFRSKFIIRNDLPSTSLDDLVSITDDVTITFGSESSTSGHLMPRFYLMEAGIDPDNDFDCRPSYSGSHDKTWKQVEAGVFQGGALNEAVWQSALD